MKQITITLIIPKWADPEEVADDACDYLDTNDYLAAGALVDIIDITPEQATERFGWDPDDEYEDEGEEDETEESEAEA